MISLAEKMYLTAETRKIIVDYAKKNVLKDLMLEFLFDSTSSTESFSNLSEELYHADGDTPPYQVREDLELFIKSALQKLSKEKLLALKFWTIVTNYEFYLDRSEAFADPDNEDAYEDLGRELAYMLYIEDSPLLEDLEILLDAWLSLLATEADLSSIDDFTVECMLEAVEKYCR